MAGYRCGQGSIRFMIPSPYLLYLGSSFDSADVKTSRGLATFRTADCIGEFRHDDCPLTVGLPRLSLSGAKKAGAQTMVLGISNAGGIMDHGVIADVGAAIRAGLNVAAGLHRHLNDIPDLRELASRHDVKLFDVRVPPADIPIGTGEYRPGKRLLTVGTDCSVGKMYASLVLTEGLRKAGVDANFRATGQTGILVAGGGIALDAVVADFISGAVEQLAPARTDDGWDVIEGQGSLFHPSFAGVSTGLLHGAQPTAIVLCHDPARSEMRGLTGRNLPPLSECLAANLDVARLTSPDVRATGVCLNTSSMEENTARDLCAKTADTLCLPCTDPFRFGVASIVDSLLCSEK